MKTKFYLIILLFLGFLGLSQIVTTQQQQIAIPVDPGEINQINPLQNIFTNLEKDRIPNGLLLDAAIEFAHFKKYDGTIPDSSYTSSKLVVDVYNTLLMSRLSANSQITKTSEQFTSDWKNEQQIDIIPLGGVFYRYSEFSEITQQNAKNTGDPGTLVVNNNKVQDKYLGGIWQNPYEEKLVFALAPSVNFQFQNHHIDNE